VIEGLHRLAKGASSGCNRDSSKERTVNPVVWLIVGALLGWLACVELDPRNSGGRMANVVAGAGGALGAGFLLTTAIGLDVVRSAELSIAGLVEAAFGAVVLLVLVNLIRLVRVP